MSLSKESVFQSKEDNNRRDSFDDRFCDDLCPEILQYLSLEDKLRLECVSKQFQRTVFQRQYELYINIGNREVHKLSEIHLKELWDTSLDSLKALLKKCPNITSIEFDNDYHWPINTDKINQVFQLMTENCNNLSEVFSSNHIILSDSNFDEFHRKFGPNMKYFSYYRQITELNLFPNIEKVITGLVCDGSIIPQLKLFKLKELHLELEKLQENKLQAIIDNFPTLTHFNVLFYSSDENEFYKSLKSISNLKHLIHFSFHIKYGKTNNGLIGFFKQMANNCKNLKSIECGFDINDKNSDVKELLSQLKAFPALKRLNLWFYFVYKENQDNIDVNQLFSFELFKGLSNITHLSLHFNLYLNYRLNAKMLKHTNIYLRQTLKECILKEIDINLPKLQYLEIVKKFDTTPEELKQMADILSRLSRLESLKLKFKSGVDFKPIEEQITEKCRKIKKVEIESESDLNPLWESDGNYYGYGLGRIRF